MHSCYNPAATICFFAPPQEARATPPGWPGLCLPHLAPPLLTHSAAALEALIDLYDAWGKPDKAAEWRAKLPTEQEAVAKD